MADGGSRGVGRVVVVSVVVMRVFLWTMRMLRVRVFRVRRWQIRITGAAVRRVTAMHVVARVLFLRRFIHARGP